MAVESRRLCDLNPDEEGEPVVIIVGGQQYEVDLGETARRERLRPLLEAGREVPARRLPRSHRPLPADGAKARAWAQQNGVAVPARGRVPSHVLEQYRASLRT